MRKSPDWLPGSPDSQRFSPERLAPSPVRQTGSPHKQQRASHYKKRNEKQTESYLMVIELFYQDFLKVVMDWTN